MPPFRRTAVFTTAQLPLRLRWLVLGWVLAEIAVFVLLTHVLGLGTTLLLGLGTTVLGILAMRRLGVGAMQSLRRSLDGGAPPQGTLLDGLLAALGAVLLILPGFIANALGLVLAAPSARRAVARRFGAPGSAAAPLRRPARTDVIDLGPDDWTPVNRG